MPVEAGYSGKRGHLPKSTENTVKSQNSGSPKNQRACAFKYYKYNIERGESDESEGRK